MDGSVRGRCGGETGTIGVFVVVITIALVAVAGLVLDGGRLLAARRQAQDIAGNAARAGAQALDENDLRDGRAVIDPAAAATAVAGHLGQTPATGTASTGDDMVTVHVEMPVRLLLLTVVGRGERTVNATQQARAVQGVTAGEG